MPRLLMVAYFFPPVGGVGVERTLKHVELLPRHGWQPVVVSPANSAYRIVDPSSLARIPAGTEVHRANGLEPGHLRSGIGSMLRRPGPGGAAPAPRADPGSGPQTGAGSRIRAIANAAWAATIPRLFFPDDQVLWAPGAIRAARRAHASAAVDLVYSSSPPVSGHLAAGRIARELDVGWVADFRDPWIGNAFAAPLPRPYRAAQRRIERWIVERADRVILATERYRDQYAARYAGASHKFVHIPNGYDLEELNGGPSPVPPARGDGPYRLIYAGSVYGSQELDLFLDGVEVAVEGDPTLRDRLRVEFVGWFSQENRAVASRRLPRLEPVVTHLGYRPRAETIDLERQADAGLIIMADGPRRDAVVAAKLYEYLGLDLPVLAVAPPGEMRDILQRLEWGVGADPTPAGIAQGITRVMALPPSDRSADPGRIYERRSLTARLASLLDEVRR